MRDTPQNTSLNYYPFGSAISSRAFACGEYRFGMNGQEKDDEVEGGGNSLDFGARIYDPRLVRMLSLDPAFKDYPQYSDYSVFANNPIIFIDPDGRRFIFFAGGGDGRKGDVDYAKEFKKDLKVKNFVRKSAHTNVPLGSAGNKTGPGLWAMRQDALFALGEYAQKPVTSIKITDYRIVKAYKSVKQELISKPLEKGEQLNLAGYSFGSVVTAQSAIMLLANNNVEKIDNLVLIGSPISQNSEMYKKLQEYESSGKIGKIHYEYTEGDKVVGLASKSGEEKKKVWNETRNDAMGEKKGKHIEFADRGEKGKNERNGIAAKIKNNGVK